MLAVRLLLFNSKLGSRRPEKRNIARMAALLQLATGTWFIQGKNANGIVCERLEQTPIWEEVHEGYITENERIQLSNYQRDLQLRKVK